MNKGRIFTECYELDESGKRDENGNYILLLSEHPEADQLEQLNNIKGIQLLN